MMARMLSSSRIQRLLSSTCVERTVKALVGVLAGTLGAEASTLNVRRWFW
jgi:hypothetical protein